MAAPTSSRATFNAHAWCAIAAAVLLWPGARATPVAQGDLFDEIYRQGQSFERNLRTVRAKFTETSTSRLLKQPLVARGVLAVERPSKIVLLYMEPEARTVLIDGDTLRMVWPSRDIAQRKDIGAAQRRVEKYFVGASPAELRAHFAIDAAVDPSTPRHWLVRMTPTRRQIKEAIARIDLQVAQETVMLTSMSITFPNRDVKTMTFEQVVINEPIDPALFRLPR